MKDWLASLRHLPLVLLVIGAIIAWQRYGIEMGRQGELRQRIAAREHVIAQLVQHGRDIDSRYTADTSRFRRQQTRFRSLTDTMRLTDTVWVKSALVAADSTIVACSVALETCEHRVAVRDSLLAQKDSVLADVKKQRPGWLRRTFGCTVGPTVNNKGFGPGASCGLRF